MINIHEGLIFTYNGCKYKLCAFEASNDSFAIYNMTEDRTISRMFRGNIESMLSRPQYTIIISQPTYKEEL